MSEHSTSQHPATDYSSSAGQSAETSPPEPSASQAAEESPVSWYDIHIANRQLTIASRKGEDHVRAVEKLIGDTVRDMEELLDGQGPANTALLIALNLADQLQIIRAQDQQRGSDSEQRLEALVGKLTTTLDNPIQTGEHKKGEYTSAVYEKLEFF